mmetsp:Transcript_136452/g.345518  ORF Transcript_136452/g.345518 Transcript_136452/m.345518 type:complete len:213 (+) Transcript_136452:727-1365(+)
MEEGPLKDLVGSLLLHRIIRLHGQLQVLGLHIHDHKHWLRAITSVELMDAEVRRLDLRARRVPTDHALLGIDLLEHRKHVLVEVVVKEPYLRVPGILFKRYRKAVGDVQVEVRDLAEQRPHHSLCSTFGHSAVVVDDAQQHDGVHDNVALGRLRLRVLRRLLVGLLFFLLLVLLLLLLVVCHPAGKRRALEALQLEGCQAKAVSGHSRIDAT